MGVGLNKDVYEQMQSLLQTPVDADNAVTNAEELGLLAAAVWIEENPDEFVEGLKTGFEINSDEEEGILPDDDELQDITPKKKRHWTKRQLPIPIEDFMMKVVKPIMQQVAANKLKKNLGMVVGALAARCSIFPSADYRDNCQTNPLQTFSADLTRFHLHPNYDGKESGIAQGVLPDYDTPLAECEIPVYPTMTAEYGMTPAIIERFEALCSEYGVDSKMFTETGGSIKLSPNFLSVAAYFASDKGINREQKLWGQMTVISHVPTELLKEDDKPSYLRKPTATGRKRGRPSKKPIEATTAPTETKEEEPVAV